MIAALVLARDLDRRRQEEHERGTAIDDDGDERGGHERDPTRRSADRLLPAVARRARARRRCPRPRRAGPGGVGPSLGVRARQSSPLTNTSLVAPRTTPSCRRASAARPRPGSAGPGRPSRPRRPRTAPSATAIATSDRQRDLVRAPAGSKSSSAPTTKQTAPASVSAPWLTTKRSAHEEARRRAASAAARPS